MIDYNKEGDLHLVTMNAGPNVICPEWQQRMLDILQGKLSANAARGALLAPWWRVNQPDRWEP
jgi:hypothetical protein